MCGIAGIYRFGRVGEEEDTRVVDAMTERLQRRGPDGRGVEREGFATLGNRRLRILDLSDAGSQPMRSPDGRYLITFNGEVYNHDDVRQELGIERSELRSRTDTEILLRAWAHWGEDALDRMVGQWAFAVYDRMSQRLWLARDRFGEKPLFYHHGDGALTFASTIPALLQAPWVARELDRDAMLEYVTLRYVVSPRTVLAGVSKVPCGCMLRVGPDGVEMRRWYDPRFERHGARPPLRRQELVERFDYLLSQASRRCLVSDVPVALLLSDGIDSNSIRASLSAQDRAVTSFTFTLTEGTTGLSPAQNGNAGSEELNLLVTPQERVEKMVPAFASMTEPVGDGAALATWLLIRNARDRATVFLCGHGGDEVLGGYRLSQDRFRLSIVRSLAWLPLRLSRSALERFLYGAEPVGERRRRLLEVPARMTPAAARYLIHRPLPVEDVAQLLTPGEFPVHRYLTTVDRLYGGCGEDAEDVDRMQEVMLNTFLAENICSFADSTAMDSSAELRMPFLDRDLVAFVLSLPPRARVSRWPGRTNTKQILRWWARGRLPEEITARRKRAFPFGNLPALLVTHGDALKDRILGSTAVRGALPGVEKWLAHAPLYYRGPWEGTLWALLSLGIWCEAAGVRGAGDSATVSPS
jgi:asparagine synthase (glutamine-hydrolysing)